MAEEYGGETMFVDVSARQGTNIDGLLDAVLLTADAALDMRANPDKDARGIAIEANLDRGRGATATVLVQSGTLHVGDAIVAGAAHGRVRAMHDEHGNTVQEATPSRPVQVLGLSSVPRAGDTFVVAPDDRTARQIAERRESADRQASLAKARKRISLEDLNEALAAGKVETLNLILKGDVSGSVEALEDALLQIDVGDEVEPADHRPGCRRHHAEQHQPGDGLGRDHHRLQRAGRGSERRRGRPRGRRDPLLLGHLLGDRRGRGGAQGPAEAGVRGGPGSAPPRSARSSGPASSATSPARSSAAARSAAAPGPASPGTG
ncbi:hypothetical protein GCM10025868_07770 [Angustibacter aerolatus]|uniref:Translation initiation factor IF- 2 domain-containing protein n=1 Tax=Angustibacter aerolatus TaxID=1162965 RepID=A0ABQ6JBH5_9ACTN|nr:hypothetical protein GCM10025868_07770 [Angustibacter aerolatus]